MAYAAIDVDRGVSMRQIVKFDLKNPRKFEPDISYGGMFVYMYKDQPGVYYDTHGKELPEHMAKLAGFDVNKMAKARAKREAIKAFEDRLSAELAAEFDDVVVLKEAGDWQVIAMPMDRAKIVDKETGQAVTAVPMPRADAMVLLDNLVGTAEDVEKIETKGKGK